MALHTDGSFLNWHPHIHCIALDGGILSDGSFVEFPKVNTALLQEFFAEKVFKFRIDEQLLDEQTVELMKSWEHSGFNFFAREPIGSDDKDAWLFLARYLKKPRWPSNAFPLTNPARSRLRVTPSRLMIRKRTK